MSSDVIENRRRWVEALRSGRYEQTIGALRICHIGYCCLGVALDILDPDGWTANGGLSSHPLKDSAQLLGPEACALFGLDDLLQEELAKANDTGKSFSEIASLIEALPIAGEGQP